MQAPAGAVAAIQEIENRLVGADHPVGGPDGAQVAERGVIARQDQVITVVERHAEDRVVVRAASAARLGRRFDHRDLGAFAGQGDGGRKTGQARADDVDHSGVTPAASS